MDRDVLQGQGQGLLKETHRGGGGGGWGLSLSATRTPPGSCSTWEPRSTFPAFHHPPLHWSDPPALPPLVSPIKELQTLQTLHCLCSQRTTNPPLSLLSKTYQRWVVLLNHLLATPVPPWARPLPHQRGSLHLKGCSTQETTLSGRPFRGAIFAWHRALLYMRGNI